MADSISVGGIGLRLTSFQRRANEYRGDVSASFNNRLADGRDSPRRVWDGTCDWITPAEEASLRAVVDAGAVLCSGLVLNGEEVLCIVTVETAPEGPDVQSGPTDYTAVNVAPTLTFREA
jgi:hypothetical protein